MHQVKYHEGQSRAPAEERERRASVEETLVTDEMCPYGRGEIKDNQRPSAPRGEGLTKRYKE